MAFNLNKLATVNVTKKVKKEKQGYQTVDNSKRLVISSQSNRKNEDSTLYAKIYDTEVGKNFKSSKLDNQFGFFTKQGNDLFLVLTTSKDMVNILNLKGKPTMFGVEKQLTEITEAVPVYLRDGKEIGEFKEINTLRQAYDKTFGTKAKSSKDCVKFEIPTPTIVETTEVINGVEVKTISPALKAKLNKIFDTFGKENIIKLTKKNIDYSIGEQTIITLDIPTNKLIVSDKENSAKRYQKQPMTFKAWKLNVKGEVKVPVVDVLTTDAENTVLA